MLGLVCTFKKNSAVAECLIEAKSLVEKGWNKHYWTFIEGNGLHYCAVGAIYAAAKRSFSVVLEQFVKANNLIASEGPLSNEMCVTQWNDRPERTKEQVLKAFEKAIERVL